jgi:DNA-binding response OmpR family regulator
VAKHNNILIIDRDRALADSVAWVLRDQASISCASSAEEGRRLNNLLRPDLILIDPDLGDGLFLLKEIHSVPDPPEIIVVTADSLIEQIREMGLQNVFIKSDDPFECLVDAVLSVLGDEITMPKPGSVHLLVADDDQAIRDLLSQFLRSRGYSVLTAQNGKEVLQIIDREPQVALVLLNIVMPEMGGMETLRELMRRNPHPAVIMVSGLSDREVVQWTLNAGAFDYVLKPFNLADLEHTVVACLAYTEYRRQRWWQRLLQFVRG